MHVCCNARHNSLKHQVNTGLKSLPLYSSTPYLKCEYGARQPVERRHIHIMNVVRYPTDRLASLLRDQKVATMPQLKSTLGTSVTFTVLRKLSPLGYRSSYSHGGTYYTLNSIAQYDELGLWSYRDVYPAPFGRSQQSRTAGRPGNAQYPIRFHGALVLPRVWRKAPPTARCG